MADLLTRLSDLATRIGTEIKADRASIATKAPLASPALTGAPTAPTAATADSSTTVATTAFVKAQGYAPLASPTFTGVPAAPTPGTAVNTTQIPTTAWTTTWFAKKASPAFTGNPTAPTPLAGDVSTSLATTAFVSASFAPKASPTLSDPTFTGVPQIPNGPPALDQTAYVPNAAWVRTNAVPRYQGIAASGTVTYQRIAQVFNGGGSTGAGHVALMVSGAGSSNTSTRSTGLLEIIVLNTTITPRMTWFGAAPNAGSFAYVPNGTGIWDIYWVTSATANSPTFSVMDEQNVTLVSGEAGTTTAPTGQVAIAATTLTTASPAFTGSPTSSTPTAGDNTTKIATTAYVVTALGSYLTTATAASTYAPLASPTLTGTVTMNGATSVTAPTKAQGANDTGVATTAFVVAATAALLSSGPAFTTTSPTAPTPTAGDNTTKVATTAYVRTALGSYAPLASPSFTGVVNNDTQVNVGATSGKYASMSSLTYAFTNGATGANLGYFSSDGAGSVSVQAGSGGSANVNAPGDVSLVANSHVTILGGPVGTGTQADLGIYNDGNPRIWSNAIMNRVPNSGASVQPGTGASSMLMSLTTAGTLTTLSGVLWNPDCYATVITTRGLFVSSNGRMGTSASSRRVKDLHDEQAFTDDDLQRWLDLPVYTFHYKKGLVAKEDKHIEQIGMIAEDVHDAGFTHLVHYEEREGHKHKGRVEGIAYERMGIYNQLALRRLYDRLEAAERRIAELTGA